jgi:cell division protein FtsA
VEVSQFVLNPLASAEVVLTETERKMGVVVVDIGGGTTDMAIYIDGDVWHTSVLAVGGNHITSDIAHGLRLPISQAEEIKVQHGHALVEELGEGEFFNIRPFGENDIMQVNRRDLADIIEARVGEILGLVLQEIKRSGYDGLLPAGMVLTGGTSSLPGIRNLAQAVMGVSVRIAQPENMIGMVEKLNSPAYSTSVGLLRWAFMMSEFSPGGESPERRRRQTGRTYSTSGLSEGGEQDWKTKLKNILTRLLP